MDIHRIYGFFAKKIRPARLVRFHAAFPSSQYSTVIDFGGNLNWEMMDHRYQVTLLNIDPTIPHGRYPLMIADARKTGRRAQLRSCIF
jgi:hypothetical protein